MEGREGREGWEGGGARGLAAVQEEDNAHTGERGGGEGGGSAGDGASHFPATSGGGVRAWSRKPQACAVQPLVLALGYTKMTAPASLTMSCRWIWGGGVF